MQIKKKEMRKGGVKEFHSLQIKARLFFRRQQCCEFVVVVDSLPV